MLCTKLYYIVDNNSQHLINMVLDSAFLNEEVKKRFLSQLLIFCSQNENLNIVQFLIFDKNISHDTIINSIPTYLHIKGYRDEINKLFDKKELYFKLKLSADRDNQQDKSIKKTKI